MEEEYPIVDIPIENLHYMVEHPEFWGSKKSNNSFINRHRIFEDQLRRQGFVKAIFESVGSEAKILTENINECWQKMREHKAMINPLIVKCYEDKYYVIIGNQRLTCLKAMNYKGLVPCRVADNDDHWNKQCRPMKVHPYKDV